MFLHEQSTKHMSLKIGLDVIQSQLRWGHQEMGTAISCTECSQMAGLIQKVVETPRKHLSLHVAVLCAAVFHSKIIHSNRNH